MARPPANDAFSNRVEVAGALVVWEGRVRGSRLESWEPVLAEGTDVGSVWWTWTAPQSGRAIVSFENNSFKSAAVYQGDPPDSLRLLARTSGDNNPWGVAQLVFDVVHGETYELTVQGSTGNLGEFNARLFLDARRLELDRPVSGVGVSGRLRTTHDWAWVIEKAGDVGGWMPVITNVPWNGVVEFFDPDSEAPFQVYRARPASGP
jgi:hypothetical protein